MASVSVLSRGSNSLDMLTKRLRPTIDIHLAGQTAGLVSSYTTGDHIEGTVTISADYDTRFDEVEIVLQGSLHFLGEGYIGAMLEDRVVPS